MSNKTKLTLVGGAGTVTGANFLLEIGSQKVQVDCGMLQGRGAGDSNYKPFPYDVSSVDTLIITHAHLDHIGLIPKLVKEGFAGVIYSTPSTKEIAEIVFEDNVHLLKDDAKRRGLQPMYDDVDVAKALGLWKTIQYHTTTELKDGYSFLFKDAGHILGSAMVEFSHGGKKFVFTGDLGNSPTPFLRDTEDITDADFLLMESVYGDRNHETNPEERSMLFRQVIEEIVKRNGTLIIPAFSIERTQIILYELNKLIEGKVIPSIPVFLDSPLAIKVTEIYKNRAKNFKKSVQQEISGGDDIFDFPKLKLTLHTQESHAIHKASDPKIIIAGSGMSHGGRVMSHEMKYLPDAKNIILFVGYQVAGNLGRQIQDGAKKVKIFDKEVPVRATIEKISGFSAHKDSDGLIGFVENTTEKVQQIFVTMGEPKASMFLTQKLRDNLGVNAVAPKQGDIFEIDF